MRTVDPELWYRKIKKTSIQVTRPLKFGRQPGGMLETRIRQSFRDAVEDFWRNCSHAGAKYVNVDAMNRYEKRRHIVLISLALLLGILVLVLNYQELHERPPLVVSLQFNDNAITNNFPAVALCSNNVMSRAALKNYTRYLYRHARNKVYQYSEHEIEYNLLNLGALLTLALPPIKVDFEIFFREVEPNFNITDIMFKLSTNCSSILKRCSWRGRLKDCDSLFASRLTSLGFCCVFNSRYQPEDSGREAAVLDLIGQDYGLGVVIKEERDDFAYVRRPAYGMEMLIFAGDEYPLLESGDIRIYPLPRNASLFFNIRAFSQRPDDDVSYYSRTWRQCRMRGNGLSQCLAECRRDTAHALCGCVPYALQPQAVTTDVPTCTLSELACLNKHREKFMYLNPGDREDPALNQELQDGLYCPFCYVKCKRQLYSAEIFYSKYATKSNIFRNYLSADLSLANSTVIRVFYNIHHEVWHKLEAYTRWYEIVVKLSTQWMVVTGVSSLCYSELLYHCTFRWIHHFMRRSRIANMQPVATST